MIQMRAVTNNHVWRLILNVVVRVQFTSVFSQFDSDGLNIHTVHRFDIHILGSSSDQVLQ